MSMPISDDADVLAVSRISAVATALRVIGEITGLRLTLVARVTDDEWKACAVLDRMGFGLEVGGHLDVATTLCKEVREAKKAIVIEQASEDPLYCSHGTPRMYGFESYISVPILLRDGEYFGNLCGLDSRPLPLKSRETLAMMELYAELIGLQIETEEQHQATRNALTRERRDAELREQFIAVLGHDIRSPLSAILAGAGLLTARGQLPEVERGVVERIRRSAGRITRLVDDVLDLARGRLGGGIALTEEVIDDLPAIFLQIVEEARSTHPDRVIEIEIAPSPPFLGDSVRLAQVLANLLHNALEHSPATSPVKVSVGFEDNVLSLSVANQGEPISEQLRERLFQPFSRGADASPRTGLGLGLYIVDQVVKSHGGTVAVESSRELGTAFACRMPVRPSP